MSYLVFLETSGNQAYLFATNRLRQNIGGSQLTWETGSRWVLEAIDDEQGPNLSDKNPKKQRENIRAGIRKGGYEVVFATSGKALVIVDDRKKAKAMIAIITKRAPRKTSSTSGTVWMRSSTRSHHRFRLA